MATLGIALIARDEEESLTRLLPEIKPYVDQIVVVVDTRTTDKTREVALANGAEVFDYEWSDTPDFGAVRAFSFEQLTTDWLGWCDCDDHWIGLEAVRDLLNELDAKQPQISLLWMPYDYDFHPNNAETAVLMRERFAKRGAGWEWVRPIHEHLTNEQGLATIEVPEVRVIHQRDVSRDPARHLRNIRAIHRLTKADPHDQQAWFELATEFYLGRRWRRAIPLYKKHVEVVETIPSRYVALHRIADCYAALGDREQALFWNRQARDLNEDWADAYFGLAEIYFSQGLLDRAWQALQDGYHRGTPPTFLQLNPTDYTLLPKLTELRIYGAKGAIGEALRVAREALQAYPGHPELVYVIPLYEAFLAEQEQTKKLLDFTATLDDEANARLFGVLPLAMKSRSDVRTKLIAPTVLHQEDADVAIWCGQTLEQWGPDTPRETGIGGSETAVVEIAERLARQGIKVSVYNHCGPYEGLYRQGDLRYIDFNRFDPSKAHRLFVSWRNPMAAQLQPVAQQKWLWLHDLNVGPGLTSQNSSFFDLVRPVSQWHSDHLAHLYPFLKGKLVPTRNGVDLDRFRSGEEHQGTAHHVVWGSSPDRGLLHLLGMWPSVLDFRPKGWPADQPGPLEDAQLRICYGWESLERAARQTGQPQLLHLKNQIEAMLPHLANVQFVGRMNQVDLAREYQEGQVLAYTSDFLETFFITGVEAMAAGMVVLSTKTGAIPETCGDAAILINGHPMSNAYQEAYFQQLVELLLNVKGKWSDYHQRGLIRAKQFSWDDVVKNDWLPRIEGIAPIEVAEPVPVLAEMIA